MSTIERVGVSLDKDLLGRFDELIAGMGYGNRSEAVRDASFPAGSECGRGDISGLRSPFDRFDQ